MMFGKAQILNCMRALTAGAILFSLVSTVNAAPVGAGAAAPGFSLPVLENGPAGSQLSLESLKGKVVYVDFWASWCGPCRVSLPILSDIRTKYAAQGFEVLAVNIDENTSDATEFLGQYNVSYPVVSDPESTVPAVYEPPGMPTAYLIDKKGVVRYVHAGFNKGDEKEIEEKIQSLLAE